MARQKKLKEAHRVASKPVPSIVETLQPLKASKVYPEVKVMITYLFSDKNKLSVSLNNGPETVVTNTQMVKYTNVKTGDVIGIDGIIEGKATITISVDTTPLPPPEYVNLPVHDDFFVN